MLPLLQPGLKATSVHDVRLGQILDTLFATNLHHVFGALALKALETYAISMPWQHQDTATVSSLQRGFYVTGCADHFGNA